VPVRAAAAGDELLSATGTPYDTMETVIGLSGNAPGNLKEMGVSYNQVEMADNQTKIDVPGVLAALKPSTKVVLIQRSRGYAWRASLRPEKMKEVIEAVHAVRPDIFIMVDNCYGEFICETEPTHYGATCAWAA
jgi:cystathionine beta-lyase family protein involved in aluminum resistance